MARLRGRQARFVLGVLLLWVAARGVALWPGPVPPAGAGAPATPMIALAAAAAPMAMAVRIVGPVPAHHIAATAKRGPPPPAPSAPGPLPALIPARRATFAYAAAPPPAPSPPARASLAPLLAPTPAPARPASARRIEAQAYLFVRPGSGRASLAAGGALGGSQAAMRIAVPLGGDGARIAAAARLYAPLEARGAEAAAGLDWHPLPGAALRVSIERRIALDRGGRDAWSAYAAGGVFAGHLPAGLEGEAYAQAGVVGVRRGDLFADGALRLGRRLRFAGHRLVVGGGLWGAAQPGAARLDIGPRASLALAVAGHVLTAAIEGRLRVAGGAAPGSGAALTLAADW